ncbi:MAG: hypothetical protein ACOCUL_02745 [Bacteroidota bacterium]
MNTLISGDFFIAKYANKKLIDQSVIDLFQQADYRIMNLVASITANETKNKILYNQIRCEAHCDLTKNALKLKNETSNR